MPRQTKSSWSISRRHICSADAKMRAIAQKVGACPLRRRRDYFTILCKSVYAQQLSTKIATLLFDRFRSLFPNRRPTPKAVLRLLGPKGDPVKIKHCGLSRQKRLYLLDLARHFDRGEIPTRKFAKMSDDAIIESLTRVNGIGRWTAEMFLIFVLNRPDVWPVDDLGVQEALRRLYRLKKRPTGKESIAFGERFRPHRTLATWYLWRSLSG